MSQVFQLVWYGGTALLVLGLAFSIYLMARPGGHGQPYWGRYLQAIDFWLRLLASQTTPLQVVGYQLLGAAIICAFVYGLDMDYMIYLLPLIIPGTFIGLRIAYHKRCEAIGTQLDGWLLMLSNMLKATGNVGSAIESTALLVSSPLKEEVELLIKQIEVGMVLEDALANMYQRAPSVGLRTVVTSLRVGRRLGGDLPSLLAENATTLRESERIEGFIRSQVSQGKAQILVLALAPLALVLMFAKLTEGFYDPLLEHVLGPYIIIGCICIWIFAVYLGFKIMNVDA